jgi:Beta-lactamase
MFVLDSLRPAGFARESFQGRTAHALDAARVQALKDFVETARTQFGVPGVAVSLFTTDSVIFEGGFGVREIGKPAPVDADTLFMIASNTKSLTTGPRPSCRPTPAWASGSTSSWRMRAPSAASSSTTRSTSTFSPRPPNPRWRPPRPAEHEDGVRQNFFRRV